MRGNVAGMAMPRRVAAGLFLTVCAVSPVVGSQAEPPMETVARDVEAAFRDVMEMWAYREFWRLWDVSTSESRFTLTQNDFAALMEKGSARPAVGRQVEDLRITATSPQTAVVVARIGIEDPRNAALPQYLVRSFLFFYEYGRWRPQLSDLLGLASYTSPWPPLLLGPGVIFPSCCPARPPASRPPSNLKFRR